MIVNPTFKAAWWLRNGHLQTIWASMLRADIPLLTASERVVLADGDFIDLDTIGDLTSDKLVLILHGLEGSIQSSYARGLLRQVKKNGWYGVFMHLRGCSDEPNMHHRAYHSGETNDLIEILQHLKNKHPDKKIFAVGYSLGGNILLKYLGESGDQALVDAAVAVSVPFDLEIPVQKIQRGLARMYQQYFLGRLTRKLRRKYRHRKPPPWLNVQKRYRTLHQFDEEVTARFFDFNSADDYYRQSSSRQFLPSIRKETMIIHALDDPLMDPSVLPQKHALPDCISMVLTERGGHVGFIEGALPFVPRYWLDSVIPAFFASR